MGIGLELRKARERAGLSAKQLADRTKLSLHKIEALEKSDFERLPRGIYLDGVVKAYAREVGVDAKLAVQRLRDEIAEADATAWISEKAPAQISEKRGATKPTRLAIAPLAAVPARSEVARETRPPAPVVAATPVPSARPRFGTPWLAFAVLALAAVGFGLYVRSATRSVPDARAIAAPPSVAQATAPDPTAAVGARRAALTPDLPARAADRNAPTSVASATPAARPLSVEPPGGVRASVEPPGGVRVVPEVPGEPLSAAPVSATGITGTWDLTTQVESTSIEDHRGLRRAYRIDFRQDGDKIRGSGYQLTENGQTIGTDGQTPITLQGTMDGRELVLTFTEKGTLRTSTGRFVLNLGDDLALRGSFQSDAAKSRGSINARRRR
jgi:transcriptional regulator with XRE-family HTH domain